MACSRIVLPYTLDEYQVSHRYSIARTSALKSSAKQGVEIVEHRRFEGEKGLTAGWFTHKVYRVGNLPAWAARLVPAALRVEERAWNAYPDIRTEYTVPLLGKRFTIVVLSAHRADAGTSDNVHGLTRKQLKKRVVVDVDIATRERVLREDEVQCKHPAEYRSERGARGPLGSGWQHRGDGTPVMCAYKLVMVHCGVWGLGKKVENYVHEHWFFPLYLLTHRVAFAWMDDWFGMNMDDVKAYENETQGKLRGLVTANRGAPPQTRARL